MGLDMYLSAKRYLRSFNQEDMNVIDAITKMKISGAVGLEPREISFRVMYWRKANQIHSWFVENVQNGEDECRPHSVSAEQLAELLNLCKQVLADRSLASKLLPVQAGFFFGGTDYDDWYFAGIEDTATGLEQILSADGVDYLDFEYQSSW